MNNDKNISLMMHDNFIDWLEGMLKVINTVALTFHKSVYESKEVSFVSSYRHHHHRYFCCIEEAEELVVVNKRVAVFTNHHEKTKQKSSQGMYLSCKMFFVGKVLHTANITPYYCQ